MHKMEHINRRTWSNALDRRYYRRSTGFLNEGERVAFALPLTGNPGGRILDIGVGGGRTAGLLRDMASDYVGIDYTPEMVALARLNHPDLRFEHMDARDLGTFSDNSFDLVVFSYNGIDSVDADGRAAIMREVARVLKDDAAFVFSTFNRHWHGFKQRRPRAKIASSINPLRLGFRLLMHGVGLVRERRHAPFEQRDGEHAILLHSAHDFGIMVYATTPDQLTGQLAAGGFGGHPMLFSNEGVLLVGSRIEEHECFHVVVYKSALIDRP